MPDLDYAKVMQRLGLTVGDGADPDETPDTIWCDGGTVQIVPLNTYVKVADGSPVPWTGGNAVIECTVTDADFVDPTSNGFDGAGYLFFNGKPYVWVVDLSSPKVNPFVAEPGATHRINYVNMTADGTPVSFPSVDVRITAAGDGSSPDNFNDLTLLSPVVPGSTTPIIVGPRGVSVESAAINPVGELVFDFTDGTQQNAGEIPVTAEALEAASTAVTAADEASGAATTATTAAGTATTQAGAAVTAKTAAETAQSGAVAAKSDAEAARDDLLAQKGAPSGLAPLDADEKLPEANVPERLGEAALTASYAQRWQATTAYTATTVVTAPDGSLIARKTNGTSRATFDATEQAAWDVVVSKAGTLARVAIEQVISESGAGPDRIVEATVSGGTYAVDPADGDQFYLLITGNCTLAISGMTAGQAVTVCLIQDGTGGHTVNLPTAKQTEPTATITLTTTPDKMSTLVYYAGPFDDLYVRQMGIAATPPAPPPFTPSDLPNLRFWYRGDDLAGADGSAITSWSDASGYAGAASQANSSLQPVKQTVNGSKVARFTNDQLSTAAFAAAQGQPCTVAYLIKYSTTSGTQSVFFSQAAGGLGAYSVSGKHTCYGGSVLNSNVSMSTTVFQTVVIVYNGASSKIRVDGVEVTGSTGTGTGTISTLHLGNNAGATAGLNADLKEILGFGGAATTDQIADIEAYMETLKADLAA